MSLFALCLVACGDDDDTDDDDGDASDGVFRTCDDVPADRMGTEIEWSTLLNAGGMNAWNEVSGFEGTPGIVIRDQETCDEIIEEVVTDHDVDCTVDYDLYFVLATWFSYNAIRPEEDVEICGVYRSPDGLVVPTLINIGDGSAGESFTPVTYYHFATIDKTDEQIEFRSCQYSPETDSNQTCNW